MKESAVTWGLQIKGYKIGDGKRDFGSYLMIVSVMTLN